MKHPFWSFVSITSVFLICAMSSVASDENASDNGENPKTELLTALQNAYEASSTEQLGVFFAQWNDSVSSRIIQTLDDSVIKDVYSVYISFFRPFSSLTDDFNEGLKYAIVQGSVRYRIGNLPFTKEKSIHDFRPPLNLDGAKTVYLTAPYQQVLLDFLGPGGPIAVPEKSREEVWKRQKFLNRYVEVFPYHWWQGWNLETQPMVEIILFNMARTKATVHFSVGYKGGEAKMKKEKGQWILKGHKFTWVE